ncbi:MAG: PilT/PilU family type 4a pilus ATPase [Alphaproteobacteria bacterium]|nr:PilT/PilU family type 4a pilus ATPase [Alphaproteobacteria bacterium]
MYTMMGLLRTVVKQGASDLHVTQGSPPALRTNGRIQRLKGDPLTAEDCERLVRELLCSDDQLERFRLEQQLSFSREFPELGFFRINIYSQLGVLEASVRATARQSYGLQELGVPPVLQQLAMRDSGLILITGPTGNGKTTTFNAVIDAINFRSRRKIITIEDPVEFRHEHKQSLVVQLEVGLDTPDFATALRHVLRQDPDVIAVGELRDLESMSTAITAAETGHLVLATIHTPSAPGTISRIMDVFPAHQQNQVRVQLASTLLAVLSQRLLPRADGLGRVLATELLVCNSAVRNQIREGKLHLMQNTMSTSRTRGMQTMDNCIRDFLERGVITADTARSAVQDIATIKDLL